MDYGQRVAAVFGALLQPRSHNRCDAVKGQGMMAALPARMAAVVKFACLTGLRPSEAVESARLLNARSAGTRSSYYNQERQALEHFRFPEIFIRRTKKAYISFVTKEQLSGIGLLRGKT
jgi:hypothetical protein